MILKAEASIDIDVNRKIWITGSAEGIEPENVQEVAEALAESVVGQALEAHKAIGLPVATPEDILAAARVGDPADRRPRPEDPPSMRAFGDD